MAKAVALDEPGRRERRGYGGGAVPEQPGLSFSSPHITSVGMVTAAHSPGGSGRPDW